MFVNKFCNLKTFSCFWWQYEWQKKKSNSTPAYDTSGREFEFHLWLKDKYKATLERQMGHFWPVFFTFHFCNFRKLLTAEAPNWNERVLLFEQYGRIYSVPIESFACTDFCG